MANRLDLYKFDDVYDETYSDLLKYVIIKCHNINDTSDILQETYFEFWKILNKKELSDINIKSYLISIANNRIKKHFSLISKIKEISLFETNNKDIEIIDTIPDSLDLDNLVIRNNNWDEIWNFIKKKKNHDIPKVFYLYYKLELNIKEIANELNANESYIKHLIYRTLKELQDNFGKEE